MEINRALYLGIILLLVVDCSFVDSKVNVNARTGVDPQSENTNSSNKQASELGSVSDSNGVHKENENNGIQVNKLNQNVGEDINNNNNSDSQSGSLHANNDVKRQGEGDDGENNKSNEQKQQGGDGRKNNNLNEKPEEKGDDKTSETNPNKSVNEGESELSSKGSHVEECDPSNKCMSGKLVACLRVSGTDKYSLLILNKGEKPLKVAISAPDFVEMEKTEIQLPAKEDKEVKFTITKGGSENLIVLRAGNGHCDLDIRHFIDDNFGKESHKATYLNFTMQTPTIVVLAFAVLLMLAASWTCISFRRKQLSVSKYQRLDMDLPVSGGKAVSELNDGWDNNWGDDWDDEEAPKTPSMPVTPNLSSKGLASRRLSKEGWKD